MGGAVTIVAALAACADPVIDDNESEGYLGFSLVYCWASLIHPQQSSYMGAPPTVPVGYQSEHYAYVETDGPAEQAVTFIVRGKLGDYPNTIFDELDPEYELIVPEDYEGMKQTPLLGNNAGDIAKGADEYTAFASTSIARSGDTVAMECSAEREYWVYLE